MSSDGKDQTRLAELRAYRQQVVESRSRKVAGLYTQSKVMALERHLRQKKDTVGLDLLAELEDAIG